MLVMLTRYRKTPSERTAKNSRPGWLVMTSLSLIRYARSASERTALVLP
jgi:hypothetical protein